MCEYFINDRKVDKKTYIASERSHGFDLSPEPVTVAFGKDGDQGRFFECSAARKTGESCP